MPRASPATSSIRRSARSRPPTPPSASCASRTSSPAAPDPHAVSRKCRDFGKGSDPGAKSLGSGAMSTRTATAAGLSTVDIETGKTLDAWYPAPALGDEATPVEGLPTEERTDAVRGVKVVPVTTRIDD